MFSRAKIWPRARARRSITRFAMVIFSSLLALFPEAARAAGHGPVFGLATPTLGKGSWSLDGGVMGRSGGGEMLMARPMVGYGITSDLELSTSLPIPLYSTGNLARARMMTTMPADPDVELQLAWRFQRHALGIGNRIETTATLYVDYPIFSARDGVRVFPGLAASLVTGYASRSWYLWAGGFYRRYLGPIDQTADHLGDTAMYSLVVGYRPPFLARRELPKGDWRLFAELVGEYNFPDELGGAREPDTGGHRLFLGPTLLGLYGAWGISGGPQFAIYNDLNGVQSRDFVRYAVNFTYWWF